MQCGYYVVNAMDIIMVMLVNDGGQIHFKLT